MLDRQGQTEGRLAALETRVAFLETRVQQYGAGMAMAALMAAVAFGLALLR